MAVKQDHGGSARIHENLRDEKTQELRGRSVMDRKQELDEALNMIVEDLQPFSIVDDKGFKNFVALLDPTYPLPSRQALKNMVVQKYEEEKTKAKAVMQSVEAVSLTCDMWTSINMEEHLAVT
ncbi:putative AC transposase [Merluccius polli]|uniref:AC transposase n=1 Tax=Merluccius polli TaxID=89951 RepID=A0AA47M5G1_MERPO|nr:putative AC transposase [Merluccius polli]